VLPLLLGLLYTYNPAGHPTATKPCCGTQITCTCKLSVLHTVGSSPEASCSCSVLATQQEVEARGWGDLAAQLLEKALAGGGSSSSSSSGRVRTAV